MLTQKVGAESAASFPQLYSIQSGLYNHKWKKYPKLPSELAALNIPSELKVNKNNERFFLKDVVVDGDELIIK